MVDARKDFQAKKTSKDFLSTSRDIDLMAGCGHNKCLLHCKYCHANLDVAPLKVKVKFGALSVAG